MEQRSIPSIPWYKRAFNELYPLVYSHRNEEAARREILGLLKRLALPPHAEVLDVCCGTGRHLRFLLQAGMQALGVDLSSVLLGEARDRFGLTGRVVRGDMRQLPFGRRFHCVLNLFSSFGYFASEEQNERALREMVRVLRPGGKLVIDHMNLPYLKKHLVRRTTKRVRGGVLIQKRRFSGARVEKEITWIAPNAEPVSLNESVRVYSRDELAALLERCGVKAGAWWGGFDGAALSGASPRMIVVAEKV